MWNRKQRIILSLAFSSVVIFLLSSHHPHIADQAEKLSSIRVSYAPWSNIMTQTKGYTPPHPAQTSEITETTLPGGALTAGFTIFDRLYVRNGTVFAVTSSPDSFPETKRVLSRPLDMIAGVDLDPTPHEMQIITVEQSKSILGERAIVVDGLTFILYDTNQFLPHYYHWWGEIILGAMRVYSALSLIPGILTPLVQPSRFILPNINGHNWRDNAGVNGPLMRAGFPGCSVERKDVWEDFISLNQTFVFERAMIISRPAAHTSHLLLEWQKMISSTMNLTVPDHFWEPLRKRLVSNMIGYLPIMDRTGAVKTTPASIVPIVTYISRQGGRRSLTDADHDCLVKALRKLEGEGLCKFDIVRMERLAFKQQVEAAARTTIMVGVHGNGLTHQIWMPPSPRSTVIEIFFPEAYFHDYEILARNVGHKHYAVWNDTALTYPSGQWFSGIGNGDPADVHGNTIPVHGPVVAQLVRERLTEFSESVF